MDKATAKHLVASLLERLEADARSQNLRFGSLVSQAERTALRMMIENWGRERNDSTSAPKETPVAIHGPTQGSGKPSVTNQIVLEEVVPATQEDKVRADETVLGLNKSPKPEWVLCLDFGTAKSKAFAATDSEEPDLLELPLGKTDGDLDNSIYAVSSSVWIDDQGLVFAGSKAVRRGMDWVQSGNQRRRRLDSLKQEISQVLPDDGSERRLLGQDVNPTSVKLTYEDAITFYLAYLTDLATTELESKIGTRYVRRRFTLPWWEENQRRWATELLSQSLVKAQVLADTFRGKWHAGIHVADLKSVLNQTTQYDSRLTWLLARGEAKQTWSSDQWGGVLEPLAAASCRVWKDRADRELILVVDVGAGTTDYSLFWTVQNLGQQQTRRAFPVEPCGGAIRQAGDTLDSLLVAELLRRANLGADTGLRQRVSDGLFRRGVRRLKERLFEVGEIIEVLANDERISLTRDEFLATDGVARFSRTIRQALSDLLSKVHPSWAKSVKDRALKLVLTGGGHGLPMIRSLANENWNIAGTPVACRRVKELPDLVDEEFDADFAQEYPQLAVAMGGAMPMLLDERMSLLNWAGDASQPGSLRRYQTRGI